MAATHPKAFQTLSREELLPLLASCYQAGRLAPFIGAGMSRKKLASWEGLVKNLEQALADESGIAPADSTSRIPCPASGAYLAIKAQRLATTLRNSRPPDQFWKVVVKALEGEEFGKPGLPEQTQALAEIYWPITVSTNYDHLFYCACRRFFEDRLPPVVLGRNAEDCKQIVSALVSPYDREIIWHIQGFLGEDCPDCHVGAIESPARLDQLRGELIIGHPEYRKAANTAIHFRRCFAEVLRSRSFLFLGSSLSEEYFWNLFGEALELCGPSPVPHFALLHKDQNVDVRFLAEEMNVAVCRYDDHEELVPFLRDLKERIECPNVHIRRWAVQLPGRAELEVAPYAPFSLPHPGSETALAFVVRACPKGQFDADRDLAGQPESLRSKFRDRTFEDNRHVLCTGDGLFAVRARTRPENIGEGDSVGAAVGELLEELKGRWRSLHINLPSAGGTVPPVYGFMEAVRAFGLWAAKGKTDMRLVAHVGPQVLLNLSSRQIGLHELLTSPLIRFWTVVNGAPENETARRVLYRPPDTPLRDVLIDVLGDLTAEALEQWSISICPSPKRNLERLRGEDLNQCLTDAGVVFGSVLTLARSQPESTDAEKLAQTAASGA